MSYRANRYTFRKKRWNKDTLRRNVVLLHAIPRRVVIKKIRKQEKSNL